MHASTRRSFFLLLVTSGLLQGPSGRAAPECPRGREPRCDARAVVDTVNAVVTADIPIVAASSTPCALDRLPGAVAELLPHLPAEHRALVEECRRGGMHVRRKVSTFSLADVIDAGELATADSASLHGIFAGRAVDVAAGSGMADGPYPLTFDWAVVLDTESRTLFSFVLNCRD